MTNLRIPGPTPLPEQVRGALSGEMINHRGPLFADLLREVSHGLQPFFGTREDVLLLTASGTGGLEAALVNMLSPGDRVLAVPIGSFGTRFAEIAEAYGAQVTRLEVPWGQAMDAAAVGKAIREMGDCRAVLTTHNETSTGVLNDLGALSRVLGKMGAERPLWLVDAVSSLGAVQVAMDELGIDALVTASQKAWMAPPGLAPIAFSARAWQASEVARCPRYYWDLRSMQKSASSGGTPFTPNIPALYGLRAALKLMHEEGGAAIERRHRDAARHVRQRLSALGLSLLADDAVASPTVTAVRMPEGVSATQVQRKLRIEYDIELGAGMGALKDSVLRIAHMGLFRMDELDAAVDALRVVLGR